MNSVQENIQNNDIAIIGMAGRFPQAENLQQFWDNIKNGIECISFFSPEELREAGVDPAVLDMPNFVNARAILNDVDQFDAAFFGMTPREAEMTDPQQRLFLQCAWQALEDAACDPARYDGLIGVYAGADTNSYAAGHIFLGTAGLSGLIGNDKDYLATRVAFKFNLKGPAFTVQTACSTSLVAVQLACEALLGYQTDIALAGGVGIAFPQTAGYWYEEGSILSPDGHCRAFSADAKGTVGGDGVGVVILKRYADAVSDGDDIHALIKGAAINNDGALKVGFTAPSIQGQVDVISMAQAAADVEPESISYIETHGTGTELGDPIEVTALTEVFSSHTDKKQFCALSSLKTSVGHMNSAAGIGGLIKAILAIKHEQLPPSLNFSEPNPRIDFTNSPFYVNTELKPWLAEETPRRAGVSSFGIGGTNAHVVLEEAPVRESAGIQSNAAQLLVLSAKSDASLAAASSHLADYLEAHPETGLADVSYTLLTGRQLFKQRRLLVAENTADAVQMLHLPYTPINREVQSVGVAFLFPGQGAQYVGMGRELYEQQQLFKEIVDDCSQCLFAELDLDLRTIIYPTVQQRDKATAQLQQTYLTQPALFVLEYALAKLWQSWGVEPDAMLGHSIGEYVAACLADVFSLEDALKLVATRGRLMQGLPAGEMLMVALPEEQTRELSQQLSLAAVNAPERCVLAGTADEIAAVEQQLQQQQVVCQRLHTSHAFHSHMMEPILAEFEQAVKQVKLQAPKKAYVSNVTATWITSEQATDPGYWVKHIRQPVRFAQGVTELLKASNQLLLEVGPGKALQTLAKQQLNQLTDEAIILTTLPHAEDETPASKHLLDTLGRLYCANVSIDWSVYFAPSARRKLSLPSYAFDCQRYWLDPRQNLQLASTGQIAGGKNPNVAEWLYLPYWKPSPLIKTNAALDGEQRWLVFVDLDDELTTELLECLRERNKTLELLLVSKAAAFERLNDSHYCIDIESKDDCQRLFDELAAERKTPNKIVHLWCIEKLPEDIKDRFINAQLRGFYSVLAVLQAVAKAMPETALDLILVAETACAVTGQEQLQVDYATLLGLHNVIPLEMPQIHCRYVDIEWSLAKSDNNNNRLVKRLALEFNQPIDNHTKIAYRNGKRWQEVFTQLDANITTNSVTSDVHFRQQGVYLITGGLGSLGSVLAEYLAKAAQAKLILLGRTGLPAREEWSAWLDSHSATDRISQRIKCIQTLEDYGAEVLVLRADVADLDQLQQAITTAQAKFGVIHGVFHCAGIVAPELMQLLQDTDTAQCQLHFAGKAEGLYNLAEVLPKSLDFCLLFSSLAAYLGLLGGSAYAAANSFMDVFVHDYNSKNEQAWLSINWDGWALDTENPKNLAWQQLAIQPAEGLTALRTLLALQDIPQVLVSTHSLKARLSELRNRSERLSQAQEISTEAGGEQRERHARPDLDNEYVAPSNEIETILVDIWQDILGIDKIGVDDNFFKLGGDSLIAIQLSMRLRETFKIEFSVHNLFDDPTIASLAEKITELQQAAQQQSRELADKLALVESLSEEEVEKMLAELSAKDKEQD